MSYYVSLGDIELDKVTAVVQSSDRDISTYDSVGGGKFAVPQNKGLREWTIKCELEGHDIIKEFDKMLKKKTPVRLIVKSDDYKVSESVLLKGYNAPEEEYAGVFSTTLTVIEYAKVGVRTAAVPYVAREGTRVLPAQVIIGDGTSGTVTPYDLAKAAADQAKYDGEVNARAPQYEMIDPETGKRWDNPVTIPERTTVSLKVAAAALSEESAKGVQETKDFFSGIGNKASSYWDYLTKTPTDVAIKDWAKKTNETMTKAYEEFMSANP